MTRSKVLLAMNRKDEAAARSEASTGTGYSAPGSLLCSRTAGGEASDEAFVIYRDNAQKHPDLWFTYSGLARIYSAQGKFDDAAKEMKIAYSTAPENQKVYVDGLVKRLEARQDIN